MSDYISEPLSYEEFEDSKESAPKDSKGEFSGKQEPWRCKCKCTCERPKPTPPPPPPPPPPKPEKKEFCAFITLIPKHEEEDKKDHWCK